VVRHPLVARIVDAYEKHAGAIEALPVPVATKTARNVRKK